MILRAVGPGVEAPSEKWAALVDAELGAIDVFEVVQGEGLAESSARSRIDVGRSTELERWHLASVALHSGLSAYTRSRVEVGGLAICLLRIGGHVSTGNGLTGVYYIRMSSHGSSEAWRTECNHFEQGRKVLRGTNAGSQNIGTH